MNGARYRMSGNYVDMYCKGNIILIRIWRDQANLPIFYNSFVSTQEKKEIGPHILSAMAYSNLFTLDFFGDLQIPKDMISGINGFEM